MAMNFPANPTVGQKYTAPGGSTYVWSGVVWKVSSSSSGGDMMKSVYDPNDDGVVTNAAHATTADTSADSVNKANKDGSNATGTWPISVTGSSQYAVSAGTASLATTASNASHAATADSATSADNALTVASHHVGDTAGNIPVLDSNAKIPYAADKIIISTGDPDASGAQNWLWLKV